MGKKLLFRVDASKDIGTGHVMRCITLANEAKLRGWCSCFVLRDPSENITQLICCAGHEIQKLLSESLSKKQISSPLEHCEWLSVSQEEDAKETLDIISDFKPDWIIIDHYAMDATWHAQVNKSNAKTLVIDDLGDRNLICDVLVDQNLGASRAKYAGKISQNCKLLMGPQYALLRNEFRDWREKSLAGRIDRKIQKILITMGGVDSENYTLRVLRAVSNSDHAKSCEFTVILGGSYPHAEILHEFIKSSELNISVLSSVSNMAEIMSKADLCIGASGSTSWERCCLGLPAVIFSTANNQKAIAEQLSRAKSSIYSSLKNFRNDFEQFFGSSSKDLRQILSLNSRSVCDGLGAARIVEYLEKTIEDRNS